VPNADCPFCDVVKALAGADGYRPPGGNAVHRKVAGLHAREPRPVGDTEAGEVIAAIRRHL
jgi:hypothetical protein